MIRSDWHWNWQQSGTWHFHCYLTTSFPECHVSSFWGYYYWARWASIPSYFQIRFYHQFNVETEGLVFLTWCGYHLRCQSSWPWWPKSLRKVLWIFPRWWGVVESVGCFVLLINSRPQKGPYEKCGCWWVLIDCIPLCNMIAVAKHKKYNTETRGDLVDVARFHSWVGRRQKTSGLRHMRLTLFF